MILKQSSELTKRVVTAGLGICVFVLIIAFGGWPGICLLTTGLSLAMVYEFAKMTYSLPDQDEKRYALLIITWFVGLANLLIPDSQFAALIVSFLLLFSYFLATAGRHQDIEFQVHFKELMFTLFGIVYLVLLPLHLTWLHSLSHGAHWTMVFFLIVWAADSGAYFVGMRYGKRRLYPLISPKKSVEGAFGGLAAAFIVALLYKLLLFRGMSWGAVVLTPVLVGAVSQVGDLCESFLKRAYNIKDSGSILPGHGGFLDRFDGVVFSLPVMYACARIFS